MPKPMKPPQSTLPLPQKSCVQSSAYMTSSSSYHFCLPASGSPETRQIRISSLPVVTYVTGGRDGPPHRASVRLCTFIGRYFHLEGAIWQRQISHAIFEP